ncbi:MAG: cupin domain-containing protein [Myxococcales bacterium]|nr:cupin domain-containing protein [Myxococcales bacterium]
MKAHFLDGQDTLLTASDLAAQGVYFQQLPLDPERYQGPLDEVKADNGYIEQDIVALDPHTPNLEAICAKFIDEHTHDDDEVRFVLEGAGIFDIRSTDDRWMRVQVDAGDLIVVPKGRNHRFLLTEARSIRCVRLFKDAAGWVPIYRHAGA